MAKMKMAAAKAMKAPKMPAPAKMKAVKAAPKVKAAPMGGGFGKKGFGGGAGGY